MEQKVSGNSFRKFWSTSGGCPKIPENRNSRKIPFHSRISARAQFLPNRKSTKFNMAVIPAAQQYQCWSCFLTTDSLTALLEHKTCFLGAISSRPLGFPSGMFPVCTISRTRSSHISLVTVIFQIFELIRQVSRTSNFRKVPNAV